MKQNLELHANVKGKVQGVGFRWTVVERALEFQLSGTVKNLSNGTVEIIAQGDKPSLESFLKALKANAGLARIDSISTSYQDINKIFDSFTII